jgi:oligoendopeptidase F
VVDALGEPMLRALYDRYDAVTRAFTLPPAGAARDPDRAVRRAAVEAADKAYADHAELFAATLIDIARQENAIATLYGYDSAPARFYALHIGVSEDQVRELLGRLSRRGFVLKDYQAIRAKRVASRTGIEEPRSWDMGLSNDFTPPPSNFQRSREVILKALEPLGPDYVSQFAWLLDPANGALDLPEGQNRYRGGFSLGFPSVPVMLYVGGYDASPAKNATVIHEGGHAIQRKYLDAVSPYYVSGPRFLFEASAIFNEMLLLDEEEREASSPAEKIYFQERFLDKLAHEVFTSAEEGAFELGLYSDVAAGRIADARDLDALNGRIIGDYELFSAAEPGMKGGWMKKKLMFEDPLYLINYL